MSTDFICTIHDPKRAAEATEIFGTNHLCIKSPIPTQASLPGIDQEALIYELDLNLITPEQRTALLDHYAPKFGIDRQEAEQLLDEHGMPILADNCTITCPTHPLKWL